MKNQKKKVKEERFAFLAGSVRGSFLTDIFIRGNFSSVMPSLISFRVPHSIVHVACLERIDLAGYLIVSTLVN